MATVWLVSDERGRIAVLTIGHRVFASEQEQLSYFTWADTLYRAAASPYIADVLAYGVTDDGRPYVAATTGAQTLADQLASDPLSPAAAHRHGIDLCDALLAAHSLGLAHGAVRPSTILLLQDRAVLAGFGTTAPGLTTSIALDMFTPPEFMASASQGATTASPAGDIYNLAATLYLSLGGRLPWADAPADMLLRDQRLADIPGVPPQLLDILRATLSPDSAQRPTAVVFRRFLLALQPGIEDPVTRSVAPGALQPGGVRRIASLAVDELTTSIAGAVGGAVGGAAAAALLPAQPTAPPPPAPAPPGPPPAVPPAPAAAPPPPAADTAGSLSGIASSMATKVVVAVAVGAVIGGGVYAYKASDSLSSTGGVSQPHPSAGSPRGDRAELAGQYSLKRQSITPPSAPRLDSHLWEAADSAGKYWDRNGTTIKKLGTCTRSACRYQLGIWTGKHGMLEIIPKAGGGLSRTATICNETVCSTYTIHPEKIKSGKVSSFTLEWVALRSSSRRDPLTITQIFGATRRSG
ncbi:hypothetical protein GCM10010365_34600 [Streptomyces poonensis]|uniref:non-specific serine/threonine protein kinase n=1 Tax=Streptomyces poonensis TaxID=68255 RepID=A0A918UI44_9ACTN|nr:hypothetical protein GCM10010365_34600 [Streptomyces poonensis]GLJ92625.1 hypothetical protein GCM10017589_52350 [Streptomyces poonensis]